MACCLQACQPFVDISAEISDSIPTVATVRWSTETATSSWIEFGPSRDYGLTTPATPSGTEHEAVLLGLWQDETFHYRAVTEAGDSSRDHRIETGSFPSAMPRVDVSGDTASWSGYQILPFAGETNAVAICDPQGRVVWYWQPEAGLAMARGIVSVDGQGMLLSQLATDDDADRPFTFLQRVSWDGSQVEDIPLPMLDHDFVELPDGTIAGLVLAEREGYSALGDSIVEIDPEGNHSEVWNAWDAFDPETVGTEFLEEEHWTHANAMDYDAESDTWLVGFRHFSSVVRIDRPSGELIWGLSGEANEFEFTEGSQPTLRQHQFQLLDDGILIFDNGDTERGYSRAVQYELDTDDMVADQVWEYLHTGEIYSSIKGDVSRFDDGTTQIVWATAGEIQDIDPSGEVVWQLNTMLGTVIVYSQRVDDLYLR